MNVVNAVLRHLTGVPRWLSTNALRPISLTTVRWHKGNKSNLMSWLSKAGTSQNTARKCAGKRDKVLQAESTREIAARAMGQQLLGRRVCPPWCPWTGSCFGRIEPICGLSASLGNLAVLSPPVLEPNPYLLFWESDVHCQLHASLVVHIWFTSVCLLQSSALRLWEGGFFPHTQQSQGHWWRQWRGRCKYRKWKGALE